MKGKEGIWYKEIVDSNYDCFWPSISLDTCGYPCIAYTVPIGWRKLRYAKKEGSHWVKTVIDTTHADKLYISLRIDSNNNPRICYLCSPHLKYMWFNGVSWCATLIDTNVFQLAVGLPEIIVDKNNDSHISYHYLKPGENSTKYAVGHGPHIGVEEKVKSQKLKVENLNISPNPFIQYTEIRGRKPRGRVCVYDMVGRLAEVTNSSIIGKELPTGVYFVKVEGYKPAKIIKIR